jgi:cyclopropane-fatty-acyl-phospholipid synthase
MGLCRPVRQRGHRDQPVGRAAGLGARPPRWRPALSLDFRKQDYRDVTGQFDAVVSVEMVEALGREYWPDFMDCLARCLKPGGRAAIQYIAMRDELFDGYARNADFIQAYVFPGGMLIRTSEFRRLARGTRAAMAGSGGLRARLCRNAAAGASASTRRSGTGRLPAGFDDAVRAGCGAIT